MHFISTTPGRSNLGFFPNPARLLALSTSMLLFLALCQSAIFAAPLGTAFTYQGTLSDAANTVNFDLRFELYNAANGGTPVAPAVTRTGVDASAGHFTVTLDFGAAAFNGEARWLQVEWRPAGSTSAYEVLSPRQAVTPTPYAIYAINAASAASVPSGSIGTAALATGAVTSDKIADGTIVLADLSPGLLDGAFWRLAGNGGTTEGTHFLGTTDNRALNVQVNNSPVFRFQPAPGGGSVVGGLNSVIPASTAGAMIGGGVANTNQSAYATIAGGQRNVIQFTSSHAVIGGGLGHFIETNSSYSAISAGANNSIRRLIFTGEFASTNNAQYSAIGGGQNNLVEGGSWSVIAGGRNNLIRGDYAVVAGGEGNVAVSHSFAAGRRARAIHDGSFIWADSVNADFITTRFNEFAIRADGGLRLESSRGINLNAADTPIITRRWDVFDGTAPLVKQGHGRWGLFMEPGALTAGIPTLGARIFQVARYNPNGTFVQLLRVDQAGNLVTAGSVNPPSDRNVKQDFSAVDPEAILARVAALPIRTWSYTNEPAVRHIGPVAQDFHAAFGVGSDDTTIATVDADGVALAAIQGLHQKVEKFVRANAVQIQVLERAIERKDAEIETLKRELAAVKDQETARQEQIARLMIAVFGQDGTELQAAAAKP
jgi:trimeric autotransporter adhesin